mgnify:CR=1 FL=1
MRGRQGRPGGPECGGRSFTLDSRSYLTVHLAIRRMTPPHRICHQSWLRGTETGQQRRSRPQSPQVFLGKRQDQGGLLHLESELYLELQPSQE